MIYNKFERNTCIRLPKAAHLLAVSLQPRHSPDQCACFCKYAIHLHVFSTQPKLWLQNMWFTVFYSLAFSQDLLIRGVLQEGEAGGDTSSVFLTLNPLKILWLTNFSCLTFRILASDWMSPGSLDDSEGSPMVASSF